MREIKIILANMPINNGNRGCVALSISTMAIIRDLLVERGINYKFYLPDSGYKVNGRHTYDVAGTEIEFYSSDYADWNDLKTSIKQLATWVFKRKEYKLNRSIFKNADFILDIGQGDSFADIYGKHRFETIDRIHKVARKNGTPYCILPQTIGPFKDESIKKQAVESIEKSTMVMARDAQSLSFVKENCPQKPVNEYIDVAFFMPFKKQVFSEGKIHVGINVSSLLWHGGYTKDNQFELTVDYPKLIHEIIAYFLKIPDIQVHLVPHVVASESHVENDYEVSYHLSNQYGVDKVVLAPLFLSPIYAKNYIAGMDFFLGARMHASIAAFSSGVPVFPMAYSRKFNGLFVDTLNYAAMGDMKAESNVEMMSKIEEAFTNRIQLKETIDNRLKTTVYERGELLKKDIASFLLLK